MTHANLQSNAAVLSHVIIRLFIALTRRSMATDTSGKTTDRAMDLINPTVAAQKRSDTRKTPDRHGQLLSVSVRRK